MYSLFPFVRILILIISCICALIVPSLGFSQTKDIPKVHENWDAYTKKNRYKCPGPFDTLKVAETRTIAGQTFIHNGFKLTVEDKNGVKADHKKHIKNKEVVLGVLGAIKDVTDGTKDNYGKAISWFKKEKVDWIIANGDLALDEFDLGDVMDMLGETELPVLMLPGNSESKGSWNRLYRKRMKKYPNLVNGVLVRQIIAQGVEFWTVPGYHDKRFVHQDSGCRYNKEHLTLMRRTLTPQGDRPLVLVTHGPPRGKGKHALDYIFDKQNVGDKNLNVLIKKHNIHFGIFGHILESGGRAVGVDMAKLVKQKVRKSSLYINAGSLSADPWGMLDGSTSNGMAMLYRLTTSGKKTRASYQKKRYHPKQEW